MDSIPLIVSSIMGKKLAAGSKNIVLDVKYGAGAFMKIAEDAEILADKMVTIGKKCGRRISAVITDMDTPLGANIGNALEVKEAAELLCGGGPDDLRTVCVELASEMAALTHGISKDEARALAIGALESGKAYEKFLEWIEAQGGDVATIRDTSKLPKAEFAREVLAGGDGYIASMNAESLGLVALNLGAGRHTKDDEIDFGAGIVLHKKTGDKVSKGDVLATLYTSRQETLSLAEEQFKSALTLSDTAPEKRALIYKVIR